MRALISVYDKAGVAEFARGLTELGFEVVASGGTAAHLEEHGIEVTRVESLTGFAELLGHRVVTLHPAVHGGILARRDVAEDLADLKEHGIEPIDLVCVNLYPFEREPSVELIDIGGPSLLRGAAKNYEHVAAVSQARQYEGVLDELVGDLPGESRIDSLVERNDAPVGRHRIARERAGVRGLDRRRDRGAARVGMLDDRARGAGQVVQQ